MHNLLQLKDTFNYMYDRSSVYRCLRGAVRVWCVFGTIRFLVCECFVFFRSHNFHRVHCSVVKTLSIIVYFCSSKARIMSNECFHLQCFRRAVHHVLCGRHDTFPRWVLRIQCWAQTSDPCEMCILVPHLFRSHSFLKAHCSAFKTLLISQPSAAQTHER